MFDNKKSIKLIIGAVICTAVVLMASLVCFILAATDVWDINPAKIFFMVFTFGVGAIFFGYAMVSRGGYEYCVGAVLILIGITLAMIGIKFYIILVVDFVLILVFFLGLLLLKSSIFHIERTDERPDYKPYSEQLAERKAAEAEAEKNWVAPEIKNFSENANKNKEE